MSYSYTLRNLQTSEEYYTGLSAGEVHQITGISFNNVSRYAAQKRIYRNVWEVSFDEDDYSEFWDDELCMRWDCIRKMVLGGLKHGKGTYEEKIARWRNRAKMEDDDEEE